MMHQWSTIVESAFYIIQINLFTLVCDLQSIWKSRIARRKSGKGKKKKREAILRSSRDDADVSVVQLKLHSYVRRKRTETLEWESVGEEKKGIDERGRRREREEVKRGRKSKGGKNPRNVPREHFEIGCQWFKITPSKVPRRPLSNLSSNRILMRPTRRNGTRPWLQLHIYI